jgi:glycosyltransferase involved in cell wall biosynthesis
MTTLAVFMFAASVAWCVYAYAGYPALLAVIRSVRRRTVRRAAIRPSVSVITTVHDGEHAIRAKLEDLLAQDYPKELLELLVADDASTDGTAAIVGSEFGPRGVRLARLAERGGKEKAQKFAVASARGDILVFTDVATRMDADGISTIVRNFADPEIGCVSSVDRLVGSGASDGGEGWYVRYEMTLRTLESDVHSVVGVSGSFFAARREVCEAFSDRLQSDFRTVLESARQGFRAVVDPDVFGYYADLATGDREFDRKVRTVLRGLAVLFAERDLLNPFRYGLFAWQLASHKLARWTVPAALVVSLASCVWLAQSSAWFAVIAVAQLGALIYAGAASRRPFLVVGAPGRALVYFLLVNSSILVAWIRFLRGDRVVVWEPSRR